MTNSFFDSVGDALTRHYRPSQYFNDGTSVDSVDDVDERIEPDQPEDVDATPVIYDNLDDDAKREWLRGLRKDRDKVSYKHRVKTDKGYIKRVWTSDPDDSLANDDYNKIEITDRGFSFEYSDSIKYQRSVRLESGALSHGFGSYEVRVNVDVIPITNVASCVMSGLPIDTDIGGVRLEYVNDELIRILPVHREVFKPKPYFADYKPVDLNSILDRVDNATLTPIT